ncbi:MAG: hypothetical protein WAO61_05370 [Solirubrobacterales bacterium]
MTLGTDNGTAYTSRPYRAKLAELAITHRRGGYVERYHRRPHQFLNYRTPKKVRATWDYPEDLQ